MVDPVKPAALAPPSLSLWRAAQVLLDDPSLVAAFQEAAEAERAATTTTTKGPARRDPAALDAAASFDDAYATELHRSRYRLLDAVPLVDALAHVAGSDGVITGDEWQRLGPKFSPLALQLAERSKSAKPATGAQTRPLTDGVRPATRAALAAGSEVLVGTAQMPVLAALAAEAAQSKPLQGTRLFAVQHLFSSSYGLFEALEQAGVDPKKSHVFGKSYSSNAEVRRAMQDKGWTVQDDYGSFAADVKDGKLVGIQSPLLSALGEVLKKAAEHVPPEQVLLLDEGGKLNRMLHDVYPQHAHLCRIVEQTTNGLQSMEGTTLLAPAVSVASSQLKRDVEGPIIGEDVAASTLATLAGIDPRLADPRTTTIGVVGYGAVGSATAAAFAARGFKVVVTDIDPGAEQKAARAGAALSSSAGAGSIEVRPRAEVLGAGIIVGCTGRGCMTLDETKHVKDGAFLVSAASGDHEFPVVRTRAAIQQGAHRPPVAMKEWSKLIDDARTDIAANRAGTYAPAPTPGMDAGVQSLRFEDGRETFTFPTPRGPASLSSRDGTEALSMTNLFFRQGDRRFALLRGGTPINMDRDLPPTSIQLTRAMLFAACVQAVAETSPGWRTFSEGTQQRIESHWRQVQTTTP